jgi:glycerophosphoryl diester phosphodiesterase
MPIPLLLGHRGVRGLKSAPENTLAAFDFALSRGCDGFEFDVRLSSDEQCVICHDATIRGNTIKKCSREQLRLPLLREVLQCYQNSAFLDIELKVPGLETALIDLLNAFPPAKGYVVSSFLPEVIAKIRRLNAEIPLGLICGTTAEFAEWQRVPAKYVIVHQQLIRADVVVKRLKAEHRKVLVWTVNSPLDMVRFAGLKVDGIISDHPRKLVATLRKGRSL